MKNIFFILLTTTLVSCASVDYKQVDDRLPDNVTLTDADANGIRYVESVRYTYPEPYEQTISAKCTLLNLNNHGVTLSDFSNSIVGLYSGQIYNIESTTRTDTGDALLLSNERMTIAQGVVTGDFKYGIINIKKYFRFKMVHEPHDNQSVITFSDITTAQAESGYAQNSGFIKVGSWSEAQPMLLVGLLDTASESLHTCIKSSMD